jgi:hypothetical protein
MGAGFPFSVIKATDQGVKLNIDLQSTKCLYEQSSISTLTYDCMACSGQILSSTLSTGRVHLRKLFFFCFCYILFLPIITLSDPTSNLVRHYDFPLMLQCWKTSDTVFFFFFCPLSEPVRRFSSCSTDFSQQIAQVVLFLYLHVSLF